MSEPEKVKSILNAMTEARESFLKLERLLSNGPASYWFEKLGDYVDGVFTFAKFKVGDKVSLVSDYTGGASGWSGCKHFLKKDAPAVVDEVAFGKDGFTYGIVFDRETWLDDKGVERPVSGKHQFWFREVLLQPPT